MTFQLDQELSAVNAILGAIGQAPVTNLNFQNPEIGLIYDLLTQCNVDVQNEGWHFNTEYHYPQPVNANGRCRTPLMPFVWILVVVRSGELLMLSQGWSTL